jgi:hypothetical protein
MLLARPWPTSGEIELNQVNVRKIEGDDPATLVWWEDGDKGLAMVTGNTVTLVPAERRVLIERYRIWVPPLWLARLESPNCAYVPHRWIQDGPFDICMRDAEGRWSKVAATD